jgi:hypothetical protein
VLVRLLVPRCPGLLGGVFSKPSKFNPNRLFFPPAFFSKRTRNDLRATNNRPAGKVGRPRILLLFGLKLLMQMSLHDSLSELKLLMQITLHGILVQNQHPRFFTRNDCFFIQNLYFFTCGSFAEKKRRVFNTFGHGLVFLRKT